jgi:NAD(P)-dependent dehydrogenase (short-subunit alcohol dehydrogenase family)
VRQIWLCQSSIAEAEERFGRIDVVINTASKSTSPWSKYMGLISLAFVGAFEEISDWNFREQLEVNFFGTANIIRTVLPGMRQRRSGHIINITGLSIDIFKILLTVAGQIGTPSLSLLSAAHHAVEGYSEVGH